MLAVDDHKTGQGAPPGPRLGRREPATESKTAQVQHLTRILCSTTVLMAVTASGGGSAAAPASQSPPAVFPLTIPRAGGIAGFGDMLVVAGDDLASGARRGRSRSEGLAPETVEQLTAPASQMPRSRVTPASTRPSFPDDMVTTVRSPTGGPVRLENPQGG